MFSSKKGRIVRHPYATLALTMLAAVGVISITEKGKKLFSEKTKRLGCMMRINKQDECC